MLKSYRNRALVFTFVFLLFVIAGCSHTATRKEMDDSAAGRQEILEAPKRLDPLAEMPEEKPIVKIISGAEVSGIEEAQRKLSGKKDGFFGMKEMLHTIILRDVPVGSIVEILTEMCGYNVIASNGAAEQKISIYMQDLPLREAIESVCRLNDLWYREDMRVITLMTAEEYANEMVVRRNEKTRAFYMRYTNAEDMAKIIQAVMGAQVELKSISGEKVYGHVEADSSSGGGGSAGEAEPVLTEEDKEKLLALGITEKEGDVVALAEKIGKALPATITVFKRNNCIVARSLDETLLQEMGKIIEALDTPTNQVLLEVKILQINLGDGFESFFQIDYSDPQQTGAGGSFSRGGHDLFAMPGIGLASSTLGYVFSNEAINARIEFFASQGRAEILSTPFLMSANNSKVEFFVGEETPLRDDVTTETIYDDEGNVVTTTFEVKIKREELGTDVIISSFINEDGTVTMDIDTEISTANLNMTEITVLNEKTTTLFPLDGVNKTTIKSIIAAKSGQSVAIGGIIKEQDESEETKVPVLGDIPVLGFFFKKIIKHKTKTETVIILTPHVITHPALAGKTSGEFLNRRSSHPVIVDEEKNILEFKTKD